MKRPTEEQMAKFKKNANDSSLSAEVRAKFQAIVDKFENVTEEIGEDVVKEVEPAKKKGRKPRATSTTKTTKTKQSPSDIEKAKAEIKKRTGKTEEECESIIEEYRALRTKAQEGKRKAEQASADNKKRVEKLEDKGDLIEGTNVKTADAVIETTAKDVAEKIEQQIEAVEEKAEKEAKVEVAKDKTIKTPKAKKEAVEKKVDEKVKKETKVVVQRVVIDTSALLTSIATTLGKFDKDSQKEFLIKLRSDIDKLLAKYAFGGLTNGATQTMNITQSNLSASSVNPTMFAEGGEVAEYKVGDNVRYLFNNRVETGEIVRRIDDESVEVRSGFSSALVNDRRIVGLAPKKRFSFFEHGGGVASRTKVEVGDEKIAIIKNRKEVKGYPVYVTSQGYAPITIGVYETKEKAEQKAMQIRKKIKYEVGGGVDNQKVFEAQEDGILGIYSGSDAYTIEISKGDRFATFGKQDNGNWWFVKNINVKPTSMMLENTFDYRESKSNLNVDWQDLVLTFPKGENSIYAEMKEVFANGGLTEHGLKLGDKIVGTSGKEKHIIDIENRGKKRKVNLETGKRSIVDYAKGGNVSSMLRNRRGM